MEKRVPHPSAFFAEGGDFDPCAPEQSIEIKVPALSRQKTARQGRGTQIESDLPRNYKGTRRPGRPRPGGRAVLATVAAQSAAGLTRASALRERC